MVLTYLMLQAGVHNVVSLPLWAVPNYIHHVLLPLLAKPLAAQGSNNGKDASLLLASPSNKLFRPYAAFRNRHLTDPSAIRAAMTASTSNSNGGTSAGGGDADAPPPAEKLWPVLQEASAHGWRDWHDAAAWGARTWGPYMWGSREILNPDARSQAGNDSNGSSPGGGSSSADDLAPNRIILALKASEGSRLLQRVRYA